MATTKDFAKYIQSKLDKDPTLKREVETLQLAGRLAHYPTQSTKHMEFTEREDGIAQMLTDLDQLARADGCIAAAWASEFIRWAADELEKHRLPQAAAAYVDHLEQLVEGDLGHEVDRVDVLDDVGVLVNACPECGSRNYFRDGDWDENGTQTAVYMLCRDCGHSGPVES